MIKVLLCSQSPSNTGGVRVWAGSVLSYFASNPVSRKVSIRLLPMNRSASLMHLLPWYKKFGLIIKDYWSLPFKLQQTLSKEKYAIVHLVSVGNLGLIRDVFFLLIAKLNKSKGVVHFHFGRIPVIKDEKNYEWYLLRIVLYLADGIIVLDKKSYNVVHEYYPDKVWKIANSVSVELSKFDIKPYKRKENKIIFVGHVIPEKGIIELLKATYDFDNIELFVYGPTSENIMKEINAFLDKNPFKGKLFFKGLQPSSVIYEELTQSSLFVLPTYTEGFPLIIIEAMVCGCPIITTPVGAIEEILQSNGEKLGYIIPVKNVEKLSDQIKYCLNNKEETFVKASKARKKALEMYSTASMVKQLEEMWESIKNC